MIRSLNQILKLALLVTILMIGLASSRTTAAECIVLLQTDWPHAPPHYVAIHGGRGTDRLHLMLKEGRHSPSDEWIVHDVEPGKIRLESHDPFYNGWFLNEIVLPYQDYDFMGARQAELFHGIQPPHDVWRLQIEPDGLHRLWSCNPDRPESALVRGRRQHPNAPVFLLLRRITSPGLRQEAGFRIIDLPSKP